MKAAIPLLQKDGSRALGAPAGPTIGLALGGGGARGMAHISVMAVIEELGLNVTSIAGTSIGSIMGWGVVSGFTASMLREAMLDAFLDSRQMARRAWRMRPKSWNGLWGRAQLDAEAVLEAFLPEAGLIDDFAEARIPLAVSATDYYGWESRLITEGPVMPAVAASIAIPVVFRPVVFEGRVYVDGGVVNPLPTGGLKRADMVIAVDVIGGPVPESEGVPTDPDNLPAGMDAILGATQLCMQTITQAHLKEHPPDVVLRPPVAEAGALNFFKAREVLAAADAEKDNMKRQIETAIERFLKQER